MFKQSLFQTFGGPGGIDGRLGGGGAAAAASSLDIMNGAKVTLLGLTTVEFNGQVGTVFNFQPGGDRVPVKLEQSGKVLNVKLANVRVLTG